MRIKDADAYKVHIPLKRSFSIAVGSIAHSQQVFVRLRSDENHVGWGETTTFHAVYGYDQKSLYNVITDHLLPAILGLDPFDIAELHQRMDLAIPHNLMAKCAVDLAAYDLMGQATNLPIHSLIGGKLLDRVPVSATIDIVNSKEAASWAEKYAELGFDTLKVKIGTGLIDDLERVQAVRHALGEMTKIRVDANQAYDRTEAFRLCRKMESLDLEWIEQPLPSWDLRGHAMLAKAIDTPVALDESIFSIQDLYHAIDLGAADVVNIKIVKCGGLYRSQKIAALCASAGIRAFLGGCTEMTPGTLAGAHFYVATPNVLSAAEIFTTVGYTGDVTAQDVTIKKGCISLPEGPGLGIKIDPALIKHYAT